MMFLLAKLAQWKKQLVMRAVFWSLMLPIVLRDYLFGNGLYLYRDWSWPLTNAIPPRASFSPTAIGNSAPDPLGFTRMFFTWPVVIIQALTSDSLAAEKVFVVYLFSIFVILSLIVAALSLRLLNVTSGSKLSHYKGEAFSLFVSVLCFANFWSLQQLSDVYYTYFSEFAFLLVSLIVIIMWRANVRSIILSGSLLSLGLFLDPNLFPHCLLAVGIVLTWVTFSGGFSSKNLSRSIGRVIALVVSTLPALLTMIYVLNETTGTNLRAAGSYRFSSVNLTLPNVVRLFGFWWSLIVYSPPSILGSGGSLASLPTSGSPPYMILPEGVITTVWLATTWLVPVTAFVAIGLRRYRAASLPAALVAIVGILLTQPAIFPYPDLIAATGLTSVPIVGGALLTVYAIPDHILIMVAAAYILLIASTVHFFLSTDYSWTLLFSKRLHLANLSPKHIRNSGRIAIPILLLLLIFPSWQFFSGSFFPGSYFSDGTGNKVPNEGALSPTQPPIEMYQIYNWLTIQPGDFNIYWPGPNGGTYPWSQASTPSISWIDSPRPTFLTSSGLPGMFPEGLKFLLSSDLTSGLSSYLAALNIRYIVAQPTSRVGLESSWGVDDFETLQTRLAMSPGISEVLQRGAIYVYEVSDPWGPYYRPNLSVQYTRGDQLYAISYNLMSSIGTHISVTHSPEVQDQLCFDSSNCAVNILTPNYLAQKLPAAISVTALDSSGTNVTTHQLKKDAYESLPNPWSKWTANNWGPNDAAVGITNSAMQWTFDGRTVLTLSYNGTVTDGRPGGFVLENNGTAFVRITFRYRTIDTSGFYLHVLVPQLDGHLVTTAIPMSPEFPAADNWTEASYEYALPDGVAYFTTRIEAEASSGILQLKDVNLGVNFMVRNYGSPFARVVPVQGANQSLGQFATTPVLFYDGSGTATWGDNTYVLNGIAGSQWFASPEIPASELKISGNLNISAIITTRVGIHRLGSGSVLQADSPSSDVIYSRMFVPGYRLITASGQHLRGIPTVDGMTLFRGVDAGNYSVEFSSIGNMTVFYAFSLFLGFFGMVVATNSSIIRQLFVFRSLRRILRKKVS